MTSLADRTIVVLRAQHDVLATVVSSLSPAQLDGPSGATDWPVAQVLSHLGSGAEITLAGFRSTLGEIPPPEDGFNQSVWDRWNALSPHDQAAGFVEANAKLVEAFEALPPEQRETFQIKLGFAPQPLTLAAFLAMRLNESTQHGWDVRVGLDPAAALTATEAQLLAEHFEDGLSFMLSFIGKPEILGRPVVIALQPTPFSLVLEDRPRMTSETIEPTATFIGPLESAIRLLAGRLTKDHTPADVTVTGNVTLDELREVFPGY